MYPMIANVIILITMYYLMVIQMIWIMTASTLIS